MDYYKRSSIVHPYRYTASGARLYHELNLTKESLPNGIRCQGPRPPYCQVADYLRKINV